MRLEYKHSGIEINKRKAGLITLFLGDVYIHFGIRKKSCRRWGYGEFEFAGTIPEFGFGPLMLICIAPKSRLGCKISNIAYKLGYVNTEDTEYPEEEYMEDDGY